MVDKRTNLSKEEVARRRLSRLQTRVMREYLDGLESVTPQRGKGRKKSPEQRIEEAKQGLATENDNLTRVLLLQKLRDAEQEKEMRDTVNMQSREDAFVEHLLAYSERKGVSYKTWRDAGVPAHVLRRGGLSRHRH